VTGLETTVLAIYDRFIKEGVFGWDLLIRKYSRAPREIVGQVFHELEEGRAADFFVFDPNAETEITREYLKTKSPVTPFRGRTFAGGIRETVVG
jgi:dihydroorotase